MTSKDIRDLNGMFLFVPKKEVLLIAENFYLGRPIEYNST